MGKVLIESPPIQAFVRTNPAGPWGSQILAAIGLGPSVIGEAVGGTAGVGR